MPMHVAPSKLSVAFFSRSCLPTLFATARGWSSPHEALELARQASWSARRALGALEPCMFAA